MADSQAAAFNLDPGTSGTRGALHARRLGERRRIKQSLGQSGTPRTIDTSLLANQASADALATADEPSGADLDQTDDQAVAQRLNQQRRSARKRRGAQTANLEQREEKLLERLGQNPFSREVMNELDSVLEQRLQRQGITMTKRARNALLRKAANKLAANLAAKWGLRSVFASLVATLILIPVAVLAANIWWIVSSQLGDYLRIPQFLRPGLFDKICIVLANFVCAIVTFIGLIIIVLLVMIVLYPREAFELFFGSGIRGFFNFVKTGIGLLF